MLFAADEIEALKSLTQNWPILAVLGTVIGWFMRSVAVPLTTRHMAFMDAMEVRDRMNSENAIKQTAILQTLSSEVSESNNRLSDMKTLVVGNRCNVPANYSGQPHGV